MLQVTMSILRPRLVLPGFLGTFAGAPPALAPAPSLAGARGLRASHAQHAVTSSRVQVSHGVEVLKGCGFDAARPGRLAPRPRAAPPPGRGPGPPPVIFVDDGPEIVIDQPGVVIIIE